MVDEAQYAVLLGHAHDAPGGLVRDPTEAGEAAGRLAGDGDGARVDEGLVALRVDAADLGADGGGLVVFADNAGRELLQVVDGEVSCMNRRQIFVKGCLALLEKREGREEEGGDGFLRTCVELQAHVAGNACIH